MTYAEKADIAAKAVKVIDSVTLGRHKRQAKNYAELARKRLLKCEDERPAMDTRVMSGFVFKTRASLLIEAIDDAFERMKGRLNKPRYTLKDGEWVRKWPEECRGVGLKAGSGHHHYMMTKMVMAQAERNNELYGPQSQSMFGN